MDEDQVTCPCGFSMYCSRGIVACMRITHRRRTPRGHTRPMESVLGWGRDVAQTQFLRKANERSASRRAQSCGNQEGRTEHHYLEYTAPRRSRTQVRSAERCTLGVSVALIRTERNVGRHTRNVL